MIVGPVRVQISKATDGKSDYMQIMSANSLSLNIVIVAVDGIDVTDDRPPKKSKASGKKASDR